MQQVPAGVFGIEHLPGYDAVKGHLIYTVPSRRIQQLCLRREIITLMRGFAVTLFLVAPLLAQRGTSELRLSVTDPAGLGVQASGTLTSRSAQERRSITTDENGQFVLRSLPVGKYFLRIERPGFAPYTDSVDLRSEIPLFYHATLKLTPIETAVTITESDTLIDPSQTGNVHHLGKDILNTRRSAAPGRSVLELVNTQPGWLLEANGVLHPRGSEYDVQYVVDGLPLFDNRSPAFAQSLGIDEFQSMRVLTGGYPAEYGRKLGGVVEVTTERDDDPGLHGRASVQGGSFGTVNGFVSTQYRWGNNLVGASGEAFATDRYLDPPVLQNFSNRGTGGAAAFRFERDWSRSDRTRFYIVRHRTGFLVPNELLQEEAGQRQDRTATETSGQFFHQHIFSPALLLNVQGRVRDTSAGLWSNPMSTPILVSQDRGFRESYFSASLAGHSGRHDWKTGVETLYSRIHENFGYRITTYDVLGVAVFDPNVPPTFDFADRGVDSEQAGFVEDSIRLGRLTLSAGIRYDHYRLRVRESAWSPRVAAAWNIPGSGFVLRASYDRVFQTPALENVLLASANLVDALGGEGVFLPLRPSRGHFAEAGFSKAFLQRLRLDGTYYHRSFDYLADDSVLLNTGISFPITFRSGTVYGFEAKVEVPRWGPFSGYLSWSNMAGRGELPIAGGLFLGDEAANLIGAAGQFPITQDQRNSLRGRARSEIGSRAWVAFGATYNSGLPTELEGLSDPDLLAQQYGARVLARVNVERDRLFPSYALDASAGATLWRHERHTVNLQADLLNLTNQLSVINFSGLFSGTAIEPGRNFAIRLTTEF